MPLVKISLRKGRSPGYKRALLDGIHSALVGAFKIPDSDRNQQLFELDPDHFEIASTKSDQFVVIEIIVFPGRSPEAKKNLYAAIVKNLEESPGIPGNDVVIVLHEPPMENWGIRGGRPASEVDVGFRIDV
ncbi:MAG: tautomerase family protein [Methanoregula sp.]|jgi:phenylpyruvate tautomerase PptA (4-oxalocrotonate tautomerase family)